jgi:hypothetical protein
MLPNFEQHVILSRLTLLLKSRDVLLVSANLAPGPDYAAGMQKILPQYENPPTRNWLMTFLLDIGVEAGDGELQFSIEDCSETNLKRIVATFRFDQSRTIQIDSEMFTFQEGDPIRLFFSFRHTPVFLKKLLVKHGLQISSQWLTRSGEEGVFMIRPE